MCAAHAANTHESDQLLECVQAMFVCALFKGDLINMIIPLYGLYSLTFLTKNIVICKKETLFGISEEFSSLKFLILNIFVNKIGFDISFGLIYPQISFLT